MCDLLSQRYSFIARKVPDFFANSPLNQLLFTDLYLMHWPDCMVPGVSSREVRAETWRALEELYDEGSCSFRFFLQFRNDQHRQFVGNVSSPLLQVCVVPLE